jgi:hypothetical protein
MKARITDKTDRTKQKEQLKEALQAESKQGNALRRLKTLSNQYDFFNLSDFQSAILSNQNDYFHCVQLAYGKKQKQKIDQLERIKEGKELITRKSYAVIQVIEATKTLAEEREQLRSFGSKDKANEYIKERRLNGRSGISFEIEVNETEISTKFSPAEMLAILQRMEAKFFESFPNAEKLTVAMLKRALNGKVTDKDKEISKEKKQSVNKAA